MVISLIAAVAENGVIGQDNELVWRLPDDFKYFKQTTSHHPVLMGRKTFESLGKPLLNRLNVVITRNPDYRPEGVVMVDSLEKALEEARKTGIDEAFVIGGAEIYWQAIATADRLYLTEVKASFEGDARFPDFDKSEWQEISRRHHPADERHAVAFDFVVWERKV
ncbi:type 3 dihydrofolate reductase [Larkinella knui]|uniref:Dihydrofolate reductase n=1 Tax=Larkinella knui TaxID=2025310 RepID=A0A3P1CDT4_9BACT|nr:dihydrofolate reductase [Larkinella knui]RRB11472.1 dihydrofolate reductase [Larkinella knui]